MGEGIPPCPRPAGNLQPPLPVSLALEGVRRFGGERKAGRRGVNACVDVLSLVPGELWEATDVRCMAVMPSLTFPFLSLLCCLRLVLGSQCSRVQTRDKNTFAIKHIRLP